VIVFMRNRPDISGTAKQCAGAGRIVPGRRGYVPVGCVKIVQDFHAPEQSSRLPHSRLIHAWPWFISGSWLVADQCMDQVLRRYTAWGLGGVESAGSGRVVQGCEKQDVSIRAYKDVFTAALNDTSGARTAINSPALFPKKRRQTLNTREVFDIATSLPGKGSAAIQETRIRTAA